VGRSLGNLGRRIRNRRRSRGRFPLAVDLLESRTLLSALTVTNTNDSGQGSLRNAIATADSQPGGGKIVFAPQVSGTIELSSGPLTITNNVQIDGPGAGQLAVSGQGASRVFVIDGGSYGGASQVTIKNLTIEDGLATSDLAFPPSGGGILDLMASLTLRDCTLDSNEAPLGGAGAMIYRGSLDENGDTWSNNVILGNASSTTVGSDTLGYDGAAVDVFAGTATSVNSAFTSNNPLGIGLFGGGISTEEGSTLTVSGGTFTGNVASDGGGISAQDGSTVSVSGSTFDENQVGDPGAGGAIFATNNTNLTVVNSSFTENSSADSGGAIWFGQIALPSTSPELIVQSSTFIGNECGFSGGAIQSVGTAAQISDSLFSGNKTTGTFLSISQGGAIGATQFAFSQSLPLTVTGCTFTNNEALGGADEIAQGGAIWNQITMTVTGSAFLLRGQPGRVWGSDFYGNAVFFYSVAAHNHDDHRQFVYRQHGDGRSRRGWRHRRRPVHPLFARKFAHDYRIDLFGQSGR
jgi:predicted outer membrane repeat protein